MHVYVDSESMKKAPQVRPASLTRAGAIQSVGALRTNQPSIGRRLMRKAIVIEDVPEMATFVVAAFEYLDFEAYSVETSELAIEFLGADDEIETVFINTSEESHINAFDLATLIARRWPEILIFIASERIDRLRHLPPCVFLAKPLHVRTLISLIGHALRTRHAGH